MTDLLTPTTVAEAIECIQSASRVRVVAGGTKTALSKDANLSLAGLRGIVEYDPLEYTFTALAGTPLSEIKAALAENGQQLCFDPPWIPAGATLGGTVAAGLSGPGRFRSGGVRDFVLGMQALAGSGEEFRAGSKVVKNAAGFDLPKLMVGSLGRFGLILEMTVKVFPQPEATATAIFKTGQIASALDVMQTVADSQMDLASLDVDHQGCVYARVSGFADSITAQTDHLQSLCDCDVEITRDDEPMWSDIREFRWAAEDCDVVKASIAPSTMPMFADALGNVAWRVCSGGHLAWIAWPRKLGEKALLDKLQDMGCPGLALTGEWTTPQLGRRTGGEFARRLRLALDPDGKFASPDEQ